MLSVSMTARMDWIDGFLAGSRAVLECLQEQGYDLDIADQFNSKMADAVMGAIGQGKIIA